MNLMKDPIVNEVRQIRDRLAAKFDYDLAGILRDAQRRERKSGHKLLHLKPRRPKVA
jgi:hypothetical protein